MKVLFLYVSTNMCRDGDLWYYDEGVASVAACLRAAGHAVAFRMVKTDDRFDEVRAWVERERGSRTLLLFMTSLMFSAYGHDLPETMPIVGSLRTATGLLTGFVGLHATTNPEEVLAHPGVDFVGRGEMEEALVELCDALDSGGDVHRVHNFWFKTEDGVRRNPLRPLLRDVDALPHPARDLVPDEAMANERDGILTVVAMRGCPMDCNFCSNPVLKGLYRGNGPWTRFKSVGRVLEEIKAAVAIDPSLRLVFFHDDIFAFGNAWSREFFARYPAEVGIPYGCNLVISQATPGFVEGLRRSGCRQVQIGIESGSEYIRNQVINKGILEADIVAALDLFRQAGIRVKCFAMMGLPQETRWRYRESVAGFARLRPDMVQIQVWEAHEGSELLGSDRGAAALAGRHYRPGADRRAWRIKFYFRFFHRYVALYEALDAMRLRQPLRARVLRVLVDATILFRHAPDLLLARDHDGRRRWPAVVLENRWLRRLAARVGGRFWRAALAREMHLASVYTWPADMGPPPSGRGWVGSVRVDGRGRSELQPAG
ncbi:MAG: radical SAM protein [Planctomycetota bacterium]